MSQGNEQETTGLRCPVLVLNKSYQPVRITDARQGFTMLYLGRARALDRNFEPLDFGDWVSTPATQDDDAIGTPGGQVRVTRVLLLTHYNHVPRVPVRLSRRNIYLRDNHTCQYCGARPGVKELNLDHVIPRSRGGGSTWENLVTSCRPCNHKKGRYTPEEANMPLTKKPRRPGWTLALRSYAKRRFAEWEPFLATAAE